MGGVDLVFLGGAALRFLSIFCIDTKWPGFVVGIIVAGIIVAGIIVAAILGVLVGALLRWAKKRRVCGRPHWISEMSVGTK